MPAARVYVDAGRSLARQYKFSHIEELLRCSRETGQVTDKCYDDIILACVSIVSPDQSQVGKFGCDLLINAVTMNNLKLFLGI